MNRKFILDFGNRQRFRGISDEDLLKEFTKNRKNEIIDEFFRRYVHLVYGLCMKYLNEEEKARDTTMVIFESLAQKITKFEIKNFKSWLYTVARNTCLMELRRKKIELPAEPAEIIHMHRVENSDDIHLIAEESRMEANLMVYLHKLNRSQQLCLDMMYFRKMSYKQIAVETGFSLKEVKSHIQNGKRNLRNFLKSGDE